MITQDKYKLVLMKAKSKDENGNPIISNYSTDEDLYDIADSIIDAEFERLKKSPMASFVNDIKLRENAEDHFSNGKMSGLDFLMKILKNIRKDCIKKSEEKFITHEKNQKQEIKTETVSTTLEINIEAVSAKEEIKNAVDNNIKINEEENLKESAEDLFELDETKYLCSGTKKKEYKVYSKFIIDRVLKNKKGSIRRVKTKSGDVLIFNEQDYQRLKHYSSPYYEKRIKKSIHDKRENQLNKEEKLRDLSVKVGNTVVSFNDIFADNPNISIEEAKKIFNHKLKIEQQKIYDKIKKQALEYRAKIIRDAQKNNRAKIRDVKFTSDINLIKKTSFDKTVDKSFSDVKRILKNTNVAIIGEKQRLLRSDSIFRQSERTWDDKYDRTITRYDKNGNIIYQDKNDPSKQARWYHTVLTISVSDIPELKEDDIFEIVGTLKPSIIKQKKSKTKINGEKHEVDFGCLFAATYFYTLVSNTPIDEVYTKQSNASEDSPASQGEKVNYWERARIAIKSNKKNHNKNAPNKTIGQIEEELRKKGTKIVSTRYVTHTHRPDEEVVRADWVMTFRNVNFKAFYSKPNKNSEKFSPDVIFDESDFRNPVTESDASVLNSDIYDDNGRIKNKTFKPYIWNLAEKISQYVDTSDPEDISIEVHNINPRWQILEYGGYTSEVNGPWHGKGKYGLPHGVTDKGFSFQAPMGFKRIVDAQYNAIMTRSALYNNKHGVNYGNASSYTRSNRSLDWNFDITKMDQKQYDKLMSLFQNEDKTLEISSIHKANGNKVWKWEPL